MARSSMNYGIKRSALRFARYSTINSCLYFLSDNDELPSMVVQNEVSLSKILGNDLSRRWVA